MSALEVLAAGNPETYAPAIFASLSRSEQRATIWAYRSRCRHVASGWGETDPQVVTPERVARRAMLAGV